MKKNRILFILGMTLLICLCAGCGKKAETAGESAAGGTEEAADTSADTSSDDAADALSDDEGDEADTPAMVLTETENDSSDASPDAGNGFAKDVKNNGGHFVGCGDYVYYRVPQEGQLIGSNLWGEYADNYIEGGSIMTAYNTKTGETSELFPDNGFGPIYIVGDNFYLTEMSDENGSYVEAVSRDGAKRESVLADSVLAVYGDAVVASRYNTDKGRNEYYLLRDGKEVKMLFYPEYEKDPGYADATVGTFVKLVGSNCLFSVQTMLDPEGEYRDELFSCNLDTDSCISLGELPKDEDIFPVWTIHQVEASGNQIWFSYATYAGTGHFLSGYKYMTADMSIAGSLTEAAQVDDSALTESEGEYEEDSVPGFILSDGTLVLTDAIHNTASVKWGFDDLCYYDNEGQEHVIASGYGYQRDDSTDAVKEVELAECVGDDIFLIRNEEERDPENDIGWREAFVRKSVRFDKVSIADGSVTTIFELKK